MIAHRFIDSILEDALVSLAPLLAVLALAALVAMDLYVTGSSADVRP